LEKGAGRRQPTLTMLMGIGLAEKSSATDT
jgi:hypothetical protein